MPRRKDMEDFVCSALFNPAGAFFRYFVQRNASIEDYYRFDAMQLMSLNFCLVAMGLLVMFEENPFEDVAVYWECLPFVFTFVSNALIFMQLFMPCTTFDRLLYIPVVWNFCVTSFALGNLMGVLCVIRNMSFDWIFRMVSAAEFIWIYYNLNTELLDYCDFLETIPR